jgi:hypothetical protein
MSNGKLIVLADALIMLNKEFKTRSHLGDLLGLVTMENILIINTPQFSLILLVLNLPSFACGNIAS